MNRYLLRIDEPQARRVEVETIFEVGGKGTLDVRMPVWTPGSYLVREHQRHVDGFAARDADGKPLAFEKLDKHTWRIRPAGARRVQVAYRLACFELTVRTNHVDASHAFLNPAATFMFAVGGEDQPCRVCIAAPAGWKTWVALPEFDGEFQARDFDALADSPFEIGPPESHAEHRFMAGGVPHELVVWGRGDLDGQKAVADTVKIIEAQAAMFGGLPYREKYLFIVLLNEKGRGGLEHRHSCALLAPRYGFSTPTGYEDFLQLVAHEFFHLWNVKRLRPSAFTPYDWTGENHTGLLWAMEGLTRAYEVITLRRAGLVTPQRFLELWAELVTQLRRTPGRLRTTLLQASYDAWIKFYRPDETTPNTTVSYYLKGGVVGMLLDLELRRRTAGQRTLDDLMRLLYQRHGRAPGLPEDGVEAAAVELCGDDSLRAWFDRALRSTDELDLDGALAGVGLKVLWHAQDGNDDKGGAEADPAKASKGSAKGWSGAALKEQGSALAVQSVAEGSPAQLAGLGAGDEIAAIDGHRGELKARLTKSAPGTKLRVSVFRGDELVELPLELAAPPADTATIVPASDATPEKRELRRAWMGADWPEPAAG